MKNKRLSLMLICVILVNMMVSFTAFAAGWSLPEGADTDKTIRFAVVADSHLQVRTEKGETTSSQTNGLKKALDAYKGLDVDALVMAGDIIMLSGEDTTKELMTPEYTELKGALDGAGYSTKVNTTEVATGKIPVIYATGNHEFPIDASTESGKVALEVFENEMGSPQNSHTIINGIHFITSGGNTYASYARHQEQWLKDEIQAAIDANPNAPVFLVLHHPMFETVIGSEDKGNHRYSDEFKQWLNTKNNVILLSAHTHANLKQSQAIWQDGFTGVTCGYTVGSSESWSQGYLVEVSGSVTTFYKMDYLSGEYISNPWVVDIKDLSTYSISGRKNAKAPQFPEGAKITVTGIDSEQATVSWPEATQTATGEYQDNYVEAYTLKVTDTDNNKVVLDKIYKTYTTTEKVTTSAVLTGLSEYTNYMVEVTAVSPLDNVSTTLKTNFTTLDPSLVRDYIVFEAEGNNVQNIYGGNNLIYEGSYRWNTSENASGKVWVKSNISKWTWDFIPEKSAYYSFELSGRYAGGTSNWSTLKVDEEDIGTFDLGFNGSDGNFPFVKTGKSIYLNGGQKYKLTLNALNSQDEAQAYLDCFRIYYTDTREVNGSTSINTKIAKAGLYGVDITGRGDMGAMATVTIDETVNGKTMSATSLQAVELNGTDGTSAPTDKIAIFYMDEGDKNVTVNVTGGNYTIDTISVYKMLDVKTRPEYIESEKYTASNTVAFTAAYGDYTDGAFNSGLYGSNITATYKFTVSADRTYRFDLIGAAENVDSTVSLTIGDNTITNAVKAGNWETKSTYIGDFDLKAGEHTITLTANSAIMINAVKISRGVGETDIVLNAVEDFDRAAGAGVGYYDSGSEAITTNCVPDPDNIDIWPKGNYYGQTLLMEGGDWFRYTVDIPRAGYYRVLLGLRDCKGSAMIVTVNETDTKEITVDRSHSGGDYVRNPFAYDNVGLFYFNQGENTVKVSRRILDKDNNNARLHQVRIVSPDITLNGVIKSSNIVKDVFENSSYNSPEVNQEKGWMRLSAPYTSNYAQHVTWTIDFPVDGTYTFYLDAALGTFASSGYIIIDDNSSNVTETVDIPSGESLTNLGSKNIIAGQHTVTFTLPDGQYNRVLVSGLKVESPDGYGAVKTVGEGTYKAIIDVTDYYAGITHNAPNTTYGTVWVPWASTAEEMSQLTAVVAIYNGDNYVRSYTTNTVTPTENADNSNLYDYKMSIDNIEVKDGQTVKIFIWDMENLKPLTDVIVYN